MAKKQSSSLNYGPDTALILGERDVRRAQAALTLAPGKGIVEGVGVIQTILSQQAKAQQDIDIEQAKANQDLQNKVKELELELQLEREKNDAKRQEELLDGRT